MVSKGTVKRQRRWNSENLEIPQNQSGTIIASTTPKNASHPTFKRSLSMSNSMASEELTKERVGKLPPSILVLHSSLDVVYNNSIEHCYHIAYCSSTITQTCYKFSQN